MSHQSDMDNHANQLNDNNDAYWQSRGEEERPEDWQTQSEKHDEKSEDNKEQHDKGK
jgi:hypothetical protein